MRKKLAAVIIISLLVITAAFALSACTGGSAKVPSSVKDFTSSKQTSGNVSVVNYQTIVKADANWDTMSLADKQKVINYAFAEARAQAAANDVTYFNVMGKSEPKEGEESQVLFMYDKDKDNVIIYVNGEKTDTVPTPAE